MSAPIATAPPRSVTVADAIRLGAHRLQDVADNPRLEARLLLGHVLGVSQTELIRNPDRITGLSDFTHALERRALHEPLALILEQREFWSLPLRVSRDTLIPRPDSETLVEAAIAACGKRHPKTILDLGTGSGCLLLALLAEFPEASGLGIDVSFATACVARDNACQLGLSDRTNFLVSDWANGVTGRFDLVVSNPPYIVQQDIAGLMPEVRLYEPILALDGGVDGYVAYRTIVPRLPDLLMQGGIAVLELGIGQAAHVSELAREAGLGVSIRLDLSQTPRAIVLHQPEW